MRGAWILDFIDKKYDSAKLKIQDELNAMVGGDDTELRAWLCYCDFKINNQDGFELLYEFGRTNHGSSEAQKMMAAFLRREGYIGKAIMLLDQAKLAHPDDSSIDIVLAKCYSENEEHDRAVIILEEASPSENPDVALALANLLEEKERASEALRIIQKCHESNPRKESIRFKYARLAQELNLHAVALSLLDDLTTDFPNSIEYWGYLGNSCLALELFDKSLVCYRRAEKLMKEGEGSQWIVSNIGNLFSNLSLSSEACNYLEKALSKEPESEYAHNRLASALKSKDENHKAYRTKCTEGFCEIRDSLKTTKQ